MKKWLFLFGFLSYYAFAKAQAGFKFINCASPKQTSEINTSFNPDYRKEKRPIINEIDLAVKVSIHKYHPFSTRYTIDSLSNFQNYVGAGPNVFLHYKIIAPIEINYDFTGRVYFLNKHVFIETGVEWQYSYSAYEKVSGSHIANNSWLYRNYPGYDTSQYSSIQKSGVTSNEIYIPIFLGVQYKFISASIGTYRGLYFWTGFWHTPDNGDNAKFQGFITSDGQKRELNPVVNVSATVINKKIKLSPYISYRFKELYAGAEVALVLKK